MLTLYVRNVPSELHHRFKVLCATRGRSIRAELIRLIEQELATVAEIANTLDAVFQPPPSRPRKRTGRRS